MGAHYCMIDGEYLPACSCLTNKDGHDLCVQHGQEYLEKLEEENANSRKLLFKAMEHIGRYRLDLVNVEGALAETKELTTEIHSFLFGKLTGGGG